MSLNAVLTSYLVLTSKPCCNSQGFCLLELISKRERILLQKEMVIKFQVSCSQNNHSMAPLPTQCLELNNFPVTRHQHSKVKERQGTDRLVLWMWPQDFFFFFFSMF